MIKVVYKDEHITIKEISDKKIQVEKWIPLYVSDMFIENILFKSKLHYHRLDYDDFMGGSIIVWERLPEKKSPVFSKLSNKYKTPISKITYGILDSYSVGGYELVQDISQIVIHNEALKRELKLNSILE